MQPVLYLLFILSGAAGLMYESVWSKYLGLFVGHSAYAQIIVIAIFLGGMSWGAYAVGRRSDRISEPLVWYAYVEILVGLLGLVFHEVFGVVSSLAYDSIFPALAGSPLLLPVKWALAAVLILPQSFLLGTTFPLMSAGVIRVVRGRPGRVLSLLYFSNSLGAAMGVLIAGFVMVRLAGLPGTVLAAAILNIIVGISALATARYLVPMALERAERKAAESPEGATSAAAFAEVETQAAAAPDSEYTDKLWRMLLIVSFGTAVASFIYEIAWIRMLSLVLGSASHSFEIMLSAFILGLALGAFWVRKRADTFRDPVGALGYVQLLMGAFALATLPVYLWSFEGTSAFMSMLVRSDSSYEFFTMARYVVCLAVMLPSTFCAGVTLPLITRTLLTSGRGERAIGTVYSINTLGSIIGVAAAGLLVLPILGLKMTLIAAAAVDMGLGVMLLAFTGKTMSFAKPRVILATGGLACMVIVAIAAVNFDASLLTSGVFRTGTIAREPGRHVVYLKDGRTTTVSVTQLNADSLVVIATNGKPDASLRHSTFRDGPPSGRKETLSGDASTQYLVPLIALAHVPNAKLGTIIGHGSGMSSHALLASPNLERLYTIEIEPRMIEGSRFFYPANKRVFDDTARSKFIIDDAKSYFAASGQKFDIIISEPSNPWVSGVAGLFTQEFYKRITRYMADDGIFAQWLHVYEISDGLVLSVLAALHQTFPSYQIFQTSGGDIVIVAGLQRSLPTPDWNVFQFPDVKNDLRHVVQYDSATLEATRILSRQVLEPLLDSWTQPNSDYFPVLDLGAERTRFLRESAVGVSAMWAQGFNVAASLMNRRAGADDDKLAVLPGLGSVYFRSLSARARRGGELTADDSVNFPALAAFQQAKWTFDAALASPTPPRNWNRWFNDFVRLEEQLHSGTSGFIDEAFYSSAERFMTKYRAPQNVVQSIRFLRALAEWDYKEVAAAVDSITVLSSDGTALLAPDFLRDGGVIAKLRLNDVKGARADFDRRTNAPGTRPIGHFQTRLLEAHLKEAEAAGGGGAGPSGGG